MEVLHEAPKASTFVPLAEHQSATPASFYTGPPVLHYHSSQSKVIILSPEIEKAPAFGALVQHAQPVESTAHAAEANGDADDGETETQRVLDNVDIFVTSDKLLLFASAAGAEAGAGAGVAIPYPTISLHAIQTLPTTSGSGQGVYMQLITSTDDDEEVDSVSVTLVPAAAAGTSGSTTGEERDDDTEQESPAQALFNALSNCSNLHPDPVNEDDDDGDDGEGSRLIQSGLAIPLGDGSGSGLPPPMPGSGGWITAENMHEFIDEHGNFIEQDDEDEAEADEAEGGDGAQLGPGAGTVRPREEGAADDGEDDESKWQRTS